MIRHLFTQHQALMLIKLRQKANVPWQPLKSELKNGRELMLFCAKSDSIDVKSAWNSLVSSMGKHSILYRLAYIRTRF